MVKQINITLSNKVFYSLIIIAIAVIVSVSVNAFNSGAAPSEMGHSLNEIEVPAGCSEGQVLKLVGGVWNCSDITAGTGDVTFSTVNTGQGANELYDMNQNVLTSSNPTFASVNTGTALKTKVIALGPWNMDSASSLQINHGVVFSKIRSAEAVIISDDGSLYSNIGRMGSNGNPWGAVASYLGTTGRVLIQRTDGFGFDSSSYNDATMNRGFLTITYEP